jgi:excisionase family DNA binding protein
MTVEEYASQHGLSLETVRRYIRSGKLKAKRFGRSYVISYTYDNRNDNTHHSTDDTHDWRAGDEQG